MKVNTESHSIGYTFAYTNDRQQGPQRSHPVLLKFSFYMKFSPTHSEKRGKNENYRVLVMHQQKVRIATLPLLPHYHMWGFLLALVLWKHKTLAAYVPKTVLLWRGNGKFCHLQTKSWVLSPYHTVWAFFLHPTHVL